jgi:hypothetical protein
LFSAHSVVGPASVSLCFPPSWPKSPGPVRPTWGSSPSLVRFEPPPPRVPPCVTLRRVREAEPKRQVVSFKSPIKTMSPHLQFPHSYSDAVEVILHHRPALSYPLRSLSGPIESATTSSILRYTSSHPNSTPLHPSCLNIELHPPPQLKRAT